MWHQRAMFVVLLSTLMCATAEDISDPYLDGIRAFAAKDYALARVKWEEAIVTRRTPSARNNFAYLLYYGLGGRAEPGRAILQWAAAATAAHAEADWHLGNAYLDGVALTRDKARAFAWYRCSIANAFRRSFSSDQPLENKIRDDSLDSLAKLRPTLSERELQRGEVLADECIHDDFETLFVGIEYVTPRRTQHRSVSKEGDER